MRARLSSARLNLRYGLPENPNHLLVAVALPQPLAIGFGILPVEKRLLPALYIVPISTPGRQETNVHSQSIRFINDEIDVIPIVVLPSVLYVGPRGSRSTSGSWP